MSISPKSQTWLLSQRTLTPFIVLTIMLWTIHACSQSPQQHIVHSLGASTQEVDVLWLKQEVFTQTTGYGEIMYAMPISRDSLKAINISDGTTLWNTALPLERGGGARGLLANPNAVFVTTSIFADAYDPNTGELIWSTSLGDGHVSVVPQLDTKLLRVYYGNRLIDLETETGKIIASTDKDDVVWISENTILQISPSGQLTAINQQTGNSIWSNKKSFYIDESQEPINIGNEKLIVGLIKGICVLDLRTGEYSWCHPEIDISNVATNNQSQLGFAVRNDLMLLTIDLETGNVLGETRFLSSEPVDEQKGSVSSITYSNGVVVVSFSDSGQTFALGIKGTK
jgi:outer membrane protein assembly factor BamB